MINSTLISVLKTFDPGEFREFGRFVASPIHNGRSELIRFFGLIKKYYPDFDSKNFNKQELFKSLYPSKKYDESVVRKLTSFLMKLAEEYLAFDGLRKDKFYSEMSLIIRLSDKGLHTQATKKLRAIDDKYRVFDGDSEFFFWKKFLIERHKNVVFSYNHQDHLASEAILRRTDYLSYHFAIMSSKAQMSLRLDEKNFNSNHTESDFNKLAANTGLKEFVMHLKNSGNVNYAAIALNYFESMAFLHPDSETYFNDFKNLLETESVKFSFVEQVNFYTMFEAICTLKIESGDEMYSSELFEAYKQMLKKKLYSYTPGGKFILRIFRNIVHTSIVLKETNWLEQFLNTYLQELPGESAKSMGNLAEALLMFQKGEFESSLEKLAKIDYELFHFKLDIKTLQLKNYFELNSIEQTYSLIDTYKHFISNNKFLSERYRQRAGSFVDITKRIIDMKSKRNADNILKLKREFSIQKNILEKDWLADKIIEFEEDRK